MNNNQRFIKIIKEGLILMAIILSLVWISNLLFPQKPSENNNIDKIKEQIGKIEEKIKTPYERKNELNKTEIIRNFKNSSKDNKPTDDFRKKLNITGQFAGGYIHIKASVNSRALEQSDGVYLKLSGKINNEYTELGGHLRRSLETPKYEIITEFLFDLSDVKYKKNYWDPDFEILSGNWLDIINSKDSQIILGFSSTTGEGNLEEVSIYYQCTSGSECSIKTEQ